MNDLEEKILKQILNEECFKRNLNPSMYSDPFLFFEEYNIPFSKTYSSDIQKAFERVEYHIYFEDNEKAKESLSAFYQDPKFYYSYNYPDCLLATYAIEILDHKGKQQTEKQWLDLYELLKDNSLISLYYFFFGYFYVQNEKFKKALSTFEKGRTQSELNQNIYMQAINDFQIAIQKDLENQLFEALRYYKKTNDQYIKDNNYLSIIGSYLNMADVYTKLYFWNPAILFYRKAFHDAKKFNDYKTIDLAYQNLAFNYLLKKDFSKTIACAKIGLKVSNKNIAVFNYMISWAYCELNEFSKARQSFEKGKKYIPEGNDYLLHIYDVLELKVHNNTSSKEYENKLLQLYKCICDDYVGSEHPFILDEMCSYYKKNNDYEKVYKYSEKILSIMELADQVEEELYEIA
ncbi:hypothetical protein WKT02_07855 [Erysipelotrichaceae bacterium HCN-30851]